MDINTALEKLSSYWDYLSLDLTDEQLEEIAEVEATIYQFVENIQRRNFSV